MSRIDLKENISPNIQKVNFRSSKSRQKTLMENKSSTIQNSPNLVSNLEFKRNLSKRKSSFVNLKRDGDGIQLNFAKNIGKITDPQSKSILLKTHSVKELKSLYKTEKDLKSEESTSEFMYNSKGRKSNFESFNKDKPEIEYVGNAKDKKGSYSKFFFKKPSSMGSSHSLTKSKIVSKDLSLFKKKKLPKVWTTERNKGKEDQYLKNLDCLARDLVTKMKGNINAKINGNKLKRLKGIKGNSLSRNYSSTTDLEITKKSINRNKVCNKSPKMSPIMEEKRAANKDINQEVNCHESPILQDTSNAPINTQNKSDSDIDSIHQQFESI